MRWSLADVLEDGYVIERRPIYDDDVGDTVLKWWVLQCDEVVLISSCENCCLEYLVGIYGITERDDTC